MNKKFWLKMGEHGEAKSAKRSFASIFFPFSLRSAILGQLEMVIFWHLTRKG
jgi:hypothetical protein